MKKSIYLIFPILSFGLLLGQTATPPSAGSGTQSDPYQIATLDNLYWIADSAYRDGYYIQTADINAAETATWFPTDTGGFYGWKPILHFKGSYDGQGYIIDSLYISRDTSYIGFFKDICGDHSIISNLGLTNVQISGGDYVGGLVGLAFTYSTIHYCYCSGSITGNRYVGGLTGENTLSEISYCYTDVTVKGNRIIGGLSGAGFVNPSISNCYSNGSVSSEGGRCGGLVGWSSSFTISFCYSTCSVSGNEDIGGLIGYKSYSSSINNSFWDMETSGLDSSAEGSGRTTAEMKTQSTYTDSGWNFTDIWMIDPAYNNGYPVLRWHPGVGVKEEILPESAFLHQNYPNPLNPTTTISYELHESQNITLQVFDISGRLIETLYNGYKDAGHWDVTWNAGDHSSGVYIYRLKYGNQYISRKMLLLK